MRSCSIDWRTYRPATLTKPCKSKGFWGVAGRWGRKSMGRDRPGLPRDEIARAFDFDPVVVRMNLNGSKMGPRPGQAFGVTFHRIVIRIMGSAELSHSRRRSRARIARNRCVPVCGHGAGYFGLGLASLWAQFRFELEDFRPDPCNFSGSCELNRAGRTGEGFSTDFRAAQW